jgi:hypothetical protein
MGACAILPRIIGQSRASELLYTGRFMTAEEGERWGFFSRIVTPEQVLSQAQALAKQISEGPTFANTMTKRMLAMEWAMSVEEAIEAEAVAQALCMTTADFARAFRGVFQQGEAGVSGQSPHGEEALLAPSRTIEARGPSFETPRKGAAPQNEVGVLGTCRKITLGLK